MASIKCIMNGQLFDSADCEEVATVPVNNVVGKHQTIFLTKGGKKFVSVTDGRASVIKKPEVKLLLERYQRVEAFEKYFRPTKVE